MSIGMTCSKITACGTPAVVWLHVHDEKFDYKMSEEKKILLFQDTIKADPHETDAKGRF